MNITTRKLVLLLDALISLPLILFISFFLIMIWTYRKLFYSHNKEKIIAFIVGSSYTISDMKTKTNSIKHLMTVLNPNETFDKVVFYFFPGKENITLHYQNHILFEKKQLFKGSVLQLNGLYFLFSILISIYYCIKNGVNFIYAYDPYGAGLLALIVSKTLNLKSGMSQGTDYWETKIVPEFVSNEKIRKTIEKLIYSNADVIEMPHSYIDTIRKIHGDHLADRCTPYHYPVDLDYINAAKAKSSSKVDAIINNSENKKIILTVSRISPEKHYTEYVNLAKSFQDDETVLFLYVGDGPERKKFTDMIDGMNNFVWVPSLTNSEVIYLYSKIDLFIGIYVGMALREAMGVGCPIIVYSWDVLKYDLDDAGIQVQPFSLNSLIESIKLVLSDKKLQNDLKVKSRKRAESILSATVVAKNRRKRYFKIIGIKSENSQ